MGRTLIITEKPSVAREYANVLGVHGKGNGYIENDQYVICWCVGHLIAMSYPDKYDEKYAKWNLEDLPFIPQEYLYEVIPEVAAQFKVLKGFMNSKDIDTILYGGDSGREGEYIGRLVRMHGGVRKGMVEKRIWIDSFTEDSIRKGIRDAKPLSEYDSLSDSAYERAKEDYLTGINFSRALSCKYGYKYNKMLKSEKYKPLTVGRVMTCVMGMIVAREREIRNFKSTDYYRVLANINGIETSWKVQPKSCVYNNPVLYNETGFKQESDASKFISWLPDTLKITEAKSTTEKKKAPLLYNLAELQSDCSKIFKISPDHTLEIAQSLYEKKLTTYPRTDARVLSSAVAAEIDKTISGLKSHPGDIGTFAAQALSSGSWKSIGKSVYTDDSKITDHYAIIPTYDLHQLNALNDLERKVYDLIVKRFLAIFYPPAVYTKTNLEATAYKSNYEEKFSTSTKFITDPGYMVVSGIPEKDPDKKQDLAKAILALKEGQEVKAEYSIAKSETQPPKRYTSGTMILAMENAGNLIEDEELREQIKGSGIGTSATRAEVIQKLVKVGYIKLDNKTQVLSPLAAGEILYDIVAMVIPDLLSPKMTASWERGLDQIRDKKITWKQYDELINKYVEKGVSEIKSSGDFNTSVSADAATKTENMSCPVCKAPLKRISFKDKNTGKAKFGYGCSTSNKEGTGCKFVIWGTQYGKDLSDTQIKALVEKGQTGLVKGFKKKDGSGTYDAALQMSLEDGVAKVSLVFPERKPKAD